MKNINVGGYTIDTFFVVATLACLFLATILEGKAWDCLLGALVIATLGAIDVILQSIEKWENK